ncbi:alpha/beta hydrolase family protein [Phenylobacterium sp. VNQ135]|uniref:alpha/beta hydrolase family protein n=1 Tax=Phenylobacterium sp. VNQ135 TaxID=3400922 RepID=UPI003C05809D
MEANRTVLELRLQDLVHPDLPTRVLARHEADGAASLSSLRFSADSRSLVFIDPADRKRLRLVDLATGAASSLAPPVTGEGDGYVSIADVDWSAGDRRLAVIVNRTVPAPALQQGVSVSPEWNHRTPLQPSGESRLLVLDRATGAVLARSQTGLLLSEVNGSPATELVALAGFARRGVGEAATTDGQLFTRVGLFDPKTGAIDFVGPAYSDNPRFSPDAKTLAFRTAVDGDVYKPAQVGLYRIADRRIARFGETWDGGAPQDFEWIDGKTLAGWGYEGLGCGIQFVDVTARRTWSAGSRSLACDQRPAVARARGEVVFVRQHYEKMPDLWASSAARWAPRRLTNLNPDLNVRLEASAQVRELTWPSRDGRFTIHGVLLTPRDRPGPFPLIASIMGGPSPVTAALMGDGNAQHLNQPSLAAGYAVLLPATRGRGGFGRAFAHGIRNYSDYMAGPLTDVLEGVALVEKMGLARPDETAWMGFSYGASLGAYATTQTTKFKAALLGDTGEQDYLNTAFRRIGSYGHHIAEINTGQEDPFTPEGIAHLRSISSVTYLPRSTTPTMLQCGVLAPAVQQGCMVVFQGLSYLKVPTEMVVYPRTGHGITEPGLQYDAERRRLAWFDRWMTAPRWTPSAAVDERLRGGARQ